MGNCANLSAAGREPLELQLTLSMFLPKETSIESRHRQHRDTMTLQYQFIYNTASLSAIKCNSLNKVRTFRLLRDM